MIAVLQLHYLQHLLLEMLTAAAVVVVVELRQLVVPLVPVTVAVVAEVIVFVHYSGIAMHKL